MSRIAIVGGTKGIGRDIQVHLRLAGHECDVMGRTEVPYNSDAMLLCQRYRGEDEWAGELDVSLTRTKSLMEHAANLGKPMSVVVMASVAGVSVEDEQPVSYHAAKAALIEMVKYYAVTLAPTIRINAIIPGLTIKPEARPFYDSQPLLEQTYESITPLQRTCTVQDVAFEVNHLIDERCYMTGQTVVLDGGISLRSNWAVARRVHPQLKHLQVTQRAMVAK